MKTLALCNAALWAAAILAAAVVGAPRFLSLILLPGLGAMAMLVPRRPQRHDAR